MIRTLPEKSGRVFILKKFNIDLTFAGRWIIVFQVLKLRYKPKKKNEHIKKSESGFKTIRSQPEE